MPSSHETIDVRQDGRRVFVTLDRPEVLNAQNEAFLREFLDVTSELQNRDDFDVVAVRSSSDHFGAGLDLADFLETQTRLFASPTAEARLSDAVAQFKTGGRPSLDAGWFPLR